MKLSWRRAAVAPWLTVKALCRYRRMRRRCAAFGGFANDDIYYALGLEISAYENVSIGQRCSSGGHVMLNAHARIEIGDDCALAYGVVINTAGHDYRAKVMNRTFFAKPVTIGADVWIGACAILLPGIRIADHAVVGAGAVVTKDVPEGAIVAGNPARVLKHRPLPPQPLKPAQRSVA